MREIYSCFINVSVGAASQAGVLFYIPYEEINMATIFGSPYNDNGGWNSGQYRPFLRGTDGTDYIYGLAGSDIIYGYRGNDHLYGQDGNDRVHAGEGDDNVYGGNGNDVLDGGAGNDYLDAGAGNDYLEGSTGNDMLKGREGNDSLNGGAGMDALHGSTGNDALNGGNDRDFLYGGADSDVLNGGNGNDYLSGGHGKDYLLGGSGKDTFDYDWVSESPVPHPLGFNPQYDFIYGFNRSEGDKLDLSGIDANAYVTGNQAFSSGQLSYNASISVFTAHVYGGGDLQIQFVATAAFSPDLDVIM